jgi:aspartate aminotransferase
MPGISERGKSMPASPIRKLVPYSEAAKKRGVHVFHLNIGQPDIPTPPGFFEAIANSDIKVLEYSHSAGITSYRKKLVEYYAKAGISVSVENIMVTTGGSEAIRFAYMSCLNPGDEVIIPEPFYANYNGFAVESGVKTVPLTTRIEDNFDLPEIAEFEKLITPRTKAILICNPGNPTGKLYSRESLLRLAEVVRKHDLYLIADEVYREFVYDDLEHFSALHLEGLEQNVIVVDSVSKRFSACGARIGAMVTRNMEVWNTALKYAQARLSPPTLGQVGSEALLDLPLSYYQEIVAEYVSRRDTLLHELRRIPGVLVPAVSGAFYMIVRLPVKNSEDFCQWILEHFQHEGATVMMAPAAGFYATPGLGLDEVRIAYVLKEEDLVKSVRCLEEALKVYPGRTVAVADSGMAR